MLNIPHKVSGVTHPLVADMYLKRDFGRGRHHEDVLVIEARGETGDPDRRLDSFDAHMVDLLSDLEELKLQAEEKIGRFDRVDIRMH